MSRQQRRQPKQYYAVPNPRGSVSMSQSGASSFYTTRKPPPSDSSHSHGSHMREQQGLMARNVATGAIGGGYGPYSYNPRDHVPAGQPNRFTNTQTDEDSETEDLHEPVQPGPVINSTSVPPYMWDTKDPDLDDALHNPDPIRDRRLDRSFNIFSMRGWANASALLILLIGLLFLFAGYPIIVHYRTLHANDAGLNAVNGTGQINELPNFPTLIDNDTPESAKTFKGVKGDSYTLVFSDEFNTDGRSFYPGDDPYWTGVDLHYWPTGDLEWYDPGQITTKNGKLVITMEERSYHNLNFVSGMLQSWNQLCFTTGYIEVSVSLPGSATQPGFWPGAWTMGNLGRAGYGATTEGMWPYSYDACDAGTYPNQTDRSGNPASVITGGNDGGPLSFQVGQRASACSCPGSDHPGPSVGSGRNVPEIDIIEAEIDVTRWQGEVSQSYQIAPYNLDYRFNNATPATTIYDDSITRFNTYRGSIYQQAVSAITDINNANYGGNKYGSYGFEYWSNPSHRDQGYITWYSDGKPSWTITPDSIGPEPDISMSERLISEEPMYIILNLGMAPSFQQQDFMHMQFPAQMFIDYVRVYQKDGAPGIGCNPDSHPTADYIERHENAYSNPNLTTWAQAGYTFPRNSMYDGC